MRITNAGKTAVIVGLLFAFYSDAAVVTSRTLTVWEEYVQQAKTDLIRHSCDPNHFLFINQQPAEHAPVSFSETFALPSAQGAMIAVPSGLIHHWTGTVFISNARALDLLAVLQDYNSYAEFYKPAVVASKLLSHTPVEYNYQLKFMQKGFGVKAGLLGEFRTTYTQLTSGTGYSVTEATSLIELRNPEGHDEQSLSPEASHGYVERVFTIVKYRESIDGVWIELETLTLSRGVPASVRWLIAPVVQRFSRQVTIDTLQRLKDKVQESQAFERASTK